MRVAGSTSLSENNHTHMYDPNDLTPPLNLFMKITHHMKKKKISQ
jgi:hypothetical protein